MNEYVIKTITDACVMQQIEKWVQINYVQNTMATRNCSRHGNKRLSGNQ